MRGVVFLALCGVVLSQQVDVWLSTGDSLKRLVQEPSITGSPNPVGGTVLRVDTSQEGQAMTGFGAALSNSAAYLIWNHPNRAQVLESLFDPINGIGITFVRLVMGGSDFNAVEPYTYDDMPAGEEDFNMENFSIDKDRDFVLPLVQEIMATYPDVTLMASPWSPPAWLKDTDNLFGGSLKAGPQYMEALADYFINFIQAYQAEGVTIDMITTQNEPMHSVNDYPTMLMPWEDQRDLIKNHMGPKFAAAGITTKILILDHNWDLTDYVLNILRDPEANQYIAGSAWHCYNGPKNAPGIVQEEFPDKEIHFTECTGGDWDNHFGSSLGWNAHHLFIGQPRVGAKSVALWNLALDENFGPRVGITGGCQDCKGVLVLATDNTVSDNPEYQIIGHFAKFIRPGARLLYSDSFEAQEIETAAFRNTDGSIVVEIMNMGWDVTTQTFQVVIDDVYYYYETLLSRSLVTFILPPP